MPLPLVLRNLGANVTGAGRRLAGSLALPRGRGFWVRLEIAAHLTELPGGVSLPGTPQPGPPLLTVLEALASAARDPRVHGVFVRIAASPGGFATTETLRRSLRAVRDAGKPVVVYADRLGAEELLLASAATRIVMPEAGSVFLVGLRAESFFWKGLLDRFGVRPDVVRVGDFKNAAESFTRTSMSESQREQLEALLDDQFEGLVGGLAEARGLAADDVRTLVDRGPYGAAAAREAGLIDDCLFPDQLEALLAELSGLPAPGENEAGSVPSVDVGVYHLWRAGTTGWLPLLRERPRFAYVVAAGMIRYGSGTRGVGSDGYRRLLSRLQHDARIRGVVLRVESPGGDALASDLLWRSVQQLSAQKPVVVSMGEVAASGGYYIAAGADAIVAEAMTLTGSIGVVGGKVDLSGLFETAGVGHDAIERGERAGLLSPARGFSPDERAVVRDEMRTMYERFLERVAEGRSLERERVRALASGRVWSGRRAQEHGLVDGLGGPLEALAEVRKRAGLTPDEDCRVELHPRRPRLGSLLGTLQPGWWPGSGR